MARRDRVAAALMSALLAPGCSVANLSYAEVERDLDAIVRAEGAGGQELVYRDDVQLAPWYARALLLLPLKPLLLLAFDATKPVHLENPSGQVRDLVEQLAPKAGSNLLRAAATAQRLVRMVELDPSALNRIVALDGLGQLAAAHRLDLMVGLERGEVQPTAPEELASWVDDFGKLRPAGRAAAGGELSAEAARRYRAAIAALTAQPLPNWTARLELIADLANALQDEGAELRPVTENALRLALRHAIQWTVVHAMQGQDRTWVDVRLRALAMLHRAGGADSVPLLLALIANRPERIAQGEPRFDPELRLRLIHLCGQLNKERALRSVRLPGREAWESVAPVDFLAEIVLDRDAFLSPLQLPALEALARCIGRARLGLGAPGGPPESDADWVRTWFSEHRPSS